MAIQTLGAALRQIDRLFTSGALTGFSDAELLELSVAGRDTLAFEALVARHGAMVLSVCRGILNDPNDAEDAFQATFLILVKKARTFHGQVALAGWLYLVAHRVAIRANVAAARRRAHERQAGQMATATRVTGPAARDEQLQALHEEIARLPDKLRLAIVLCDLQGIPQNQAAGELRLSERTLRRRLSEGRKRLKARLIDRRVAREEGILAAVFFREARAALPAGWGEATARAALAAVNNTLTAGVFSAAARKLSRDVLRLMVIQRLKLVSYAIVGAGLLAWGASAAFVSLAKEPPLAAAATPTSREQPELQAVAPKPEPDPLDTVGNFPVRGRVLDPDGKPVAHAEISVRPNIYYGWSPISPAPKGQNGRVAVCNSDGRFQFELDKASSDRPSQYGDLPSWHKALIAATAPGFGLAWVEAGSLANGGEATLRLVRDDVPIHGRVLDTQGRPIRGVNVRLGRVREVKQGVDLDAMLAPGTVDEAQISASYGYDEWIWPGGQNTWTSDVDGRFEVKGVGRDRLGLFFFHGPALADASLYVMARPVKNLSNSGPRTSRDSSLTTSDGLRSQSVHRLLVGATFEHVAGTTKPIQGVVRFKGTGKPVVDAVVHGYESATLISVSARTDSEGRFLLVGVPKGPQYQVYAWARTGIDPFLGNRISVTDTEGLKPIETTLELPRGVIVIGRLVDQATGQSVPAGICQYMKLPTNQNDEGDRRVMQPGRLSLTDPTFRLTVPPGEGMFYAAPRSPETPYTCARLSKADQGRVDVRFIPLTAFNTYRIVDVPDTAEPFTIELKLIRGKSRRGRVVGPDGTPVTGTRCYGLDATAGRVKTLTDDTFEVLGLEPDFPRQLIFAHSKRGLFASVVIEGEDTKNETPIEVRLGPPGSVRGRLIDEDGMPLAGARLSIRSKALDQGQLQPDDLAPEAATFTADADGRFQVVGLIPGIKSNISVDKKLRPNYRLDSGRVLIDILLQHPAEVRDLGDVTVKEVPR
jgi:RNA polymerase sigma factor (sigma-70 family)